MRAATTGSGAGNSPPQKHLACTLLAVGCVHAAQFLFPATAASTSSYFACAPCMQTVLFSALSFGPCSHVLPQQHDTMRALELWIVICRHYVSGCQRSGAVQCPSAWALETTDNFRKFSSVFDILPSAVEARARDDTVIFLNSNVLGMFKAMCAHKSQSRW